MIVKFSVWPPFALVLLLGCLAAVEAAEQVDFNADIKPILSDRCFLCHGPDGENREADLRLDTRDGAFAESAYGEAPRIVQPGDPQQSELYLRISSDDDDLKMPPADANLSLSPAEIAVLGRWIEQGATWDEHWAFSPPRSVTVPPVRDADWPQNEIDHFVLARLQREGLKPNPEARREKLIRRLSFDLTGLPPTLAEIDEYLADASPRAYENVVDRLLRSPRYGERMAAGWLDVARYSDTYGYQVDRDRYVWPWRDWVIRAFNNNMPYDEFVTCQLAGDLLPGATNDQILATTFNRLHPQKVEGGSVPEEFRVEYVADRNQTFATAFLGMTLECARCHDHKYDPITQQEYYQLFAFFNNIDEAGLYSYFTQSVPTPTLLLADEATQHKQAEVERKIAAAERRLTKIADDRRDAFETWLEQRDKDEADTTAAESEEDQADAVDLIAGRVAYLDFEQPPKSPNQGVPGKFGQAVRLTGDDGVALKVGNFRRFEPFSVALWLQTPDKKERAVVFHRSRAWTDAASRGYQLLVEDGCLSASLIHFWPGNAIRVRTRKEIPIGQWLHVVMTYDGSSRAEGLRIFVNGRSADCEVVRNHLHKNITGGGGDSITIGERFRDRGFTNGLVDEFQVFERQLTGIEVAQLQDGESLATALNTSVDALSKAQRQDLLAYYLSTQDDPYRAQLTELKTLRAQRSQIVDAIQEVMVMRELPEPRPSFVLQRGAYDAPGQPVSANTPAILPSFPNQLPRTRLGLARWLTDADHPLTARVAVNRLWQVCFGRGLVRTPEDFGSQGDSPTHAELLDWLARDFAAHDWDVKRLLKQLVMSATYRQSATTTAELLERDPENRLLARAPSYRLSAEMLRDNALALSGLLVDRIGGPPARPYEVEVSFKPVKRDQGDGLYRRSLYTYWKRTGPAPVMMTLDAAKRDVCRMRRERTASPLQALVLLNGPQFVEASRMLGQRLMQQSYENGEAMLVDLYRLVTSRRPDEAELQVLVELYRGQLTYFESNASATEQYLKIGDHVADAELPAAPLAAICSVANTLMNLDESVTKR